ncbi:MAG: YeaH/YhbH family protein, partial [Rubrivivax sp.]|nr:YeaH/YhbH family protein [Rubrivivax sp.]
MQHIVDRRLAGKNKSIGNRERFLRRYKDQIKEAVKRAIDGRGIRDIERGEDIHIPKKDLSEPVFGHGQGGVRETVHPGNQDYVRGDRIERPKGGQGSGSGKGQAGDSGEGEDDFVFALSKEEFMQVFFEDLALPHLVRTQLAEVPEYKSHRAGFSNDGTPNNLSVVRSMRGALGRRIALGMGPRRELHALEAELLECQQALQPGDAVAAAYIADLKDRITALRARVERIPYLDPIDLRYRNRVKTPVPTSKAVMFCLMDVSGSMDEGRKELSKRFFILLYLFLTRHYEKIDLVFIRHHTQAQEVDEQNFFHARETGGTVVSSAL